MMFQVIQTEYIKGNGWIDWGDWLGTGTVAAQLRKYRSFEDARAFVHDLSLKSKSEWSEYSKSGKKPDDIPSNPASGYKGKGWSGWGDWLGTGSVAPFDRKFRSFENAKEFTHKLGFKNKDEWKKYCKSGQKPFDIPVDPQKSYKDNGWLSWGDWLGKANIAPRQREFRPFEDARAFVHSLNLASTGQWKIYCKSQKKPNDIPTNPNKVYSNQGWSGIRDWLGIRENNEQITGPSFQVSNLRFEIS